MEKSNNYEITFYMKNGSEYRMQIYNTSKIKIINNKNRIITPTSNNFISNENGTQFVNLNEVNCFVINELTEDIENEVQK